MAVEGTTPRALGVGLMSLHTGLVWGFFGLTHVMHVEGWGGNEDPLFLYLDLDSQNHA